MVDHFDELAECGVYVKGIKTIECHLSGRCITDFYLYHDRKWSSNTPSKRKTLEMLYERVWCDA
ncbi:MAG: hypothetical protein GOVbin631_32 [Prokaryotic dsDNA virus sp.]|mgnify:FL=1|nr:MAG: hypothetical protein GOVbin631_32 [Prokaryotic dsDNA virus sp.]